MSEEKAMSLLERIRHIKSEVMKTTFRLKEAKKIGGHSCYGAGYEEGSIDSMRDQFQYLESFLRYNSLNKLLHDKKYELDALQLKLPLTNEMTTKEAYQDAFYSGSIVTINWILEQIA